MTFFVTLLWTFLTLFCDISVSYLISLKRLLFALDGSLNSERNFFVCTWVYLAVLDWMDGPLNASLLRVPLCGANNRGDHAQELWNVHMRSQLWKKSQRWKKRQKSAFGGGGTE